MNHSNINIHKDLKFWKLFLELLVNFIIQSIDNIHVTLLL